MPTYEYRCRVCRKRFEEFQRISDSPLKECKFCGGAVERLISGGSGMLFKGSGFYITDYRSEKYKKQAQSDKAETGKAPGTSAKKKNKN